MGQHLQRKTIRTGEGHTREAEHDMRLLLVQKPEDLAWPFRRGLDCHLGPLRARFRRAREERRDLGNHAARIDIAHDRNG